jgi:YceI-like domain
MILKSLFVAILSYLILISRVCSQDLLWKAENGDVYFTSDAPLELIKAESQALRGIIDPSKRTFAFSVRMNSFEGFNSEIQQTHFLENYMEQKKFPQATFQGKFIEDISFETPGSYTVRAKGMLNIHGVSKERIIRGTLQVSKNAAHLEARFMVPLSDHGITIPKIVMQKIADDIEVDIRIEFNGEQAR